MRLLVHGHLRREDLRHLLIMVVVTDALIQVLLVIRLGRQLLPDGAADFHGILRLYLVQEFVVGQVVDNCLFRLT